MSFGLPPNPRPALTCTRQQNRGASSGCARTPTEGMHESNSAHRHPHGRR
jgi:hypothetical protein